MTKASQPSYTDKICPVCGGSTVVQAAPALGTRSSKFHCSSCGAHLKVGFTPRLLWGIAMAPIVPGGVLLLYRLQPHIGLPRVAMAGLTGGFIGLAVAYTFSLIRKGMVFRPYQKQP